MGKEEEKAFPWERDAQGLRGGLFELLKVGFLTLPHQSRKVLEPNWPVFESRASKDQP